MNKLFATLTFATTHCTTLHHTGIHCCALHIHVAVRVVPVARICHSKDRSKFLEVIEMWYKDSTSLELLGWDKKAPSFKFQLPWQRAKQEAASKDPAKRTVTAVIDLTLESDDDDEVERRKKAKVETLVVE